MFKLLVLFRCILASAKCAYYDTLNYFFPMEDEWYDYYTIESYDSDRDEWWEVQGPFKWVEDAQIIEDELCLECGAPINELRIVCYIDGNRHTASRLHDGTINAYFNEVVYREALDNLRDLRII